MPKCSTCNLPYAEGRADRHRASYSHRAALGTRESRTRRPRSETARIPTADNGAENFGQRMAKVRAAKRAAAADASG